MFTTAVLLGMLLFPSVSARDVARRVDDRAAREVLQEGSGPSIERFPLDIPAAKGNPPDLIALRDRTVFRGIIIHDQDGKITICTGTEIVTVNRADMMAIVRRH
ncbi:MAG TPA: hypothetical protein VM223_19840 [Planctomycetota bacterium]|nr:hypothetical protein [Planctomycetota bacterium]